MEAFFVGGCVARSVHRPFSGGLFGQAFGAQGGLHGRAAAHTLAVGLQLRQVAQFQAHMLGPVGDGEQIGVGHTELGAGQVVLAGKLLFHPREALAQLGQDGGLVIGGGAGVEQWAKALVQFGADEIQPFLHAVALQGAAGRNQLLGWHLVGDVLHDHRAFAQGLSVVQHQEGHVAQRVDGVEVRAVLQRVGLGAGQNGFVGQAGFFQHDVGGQGAGAGAVVKLHGVWHARAGQGVEHSCTC